MRLPIVYSATGRPMYKCPLPECGAVHLIDRRKSYASKAPTRFFCNSCKTPFHAKESEIQEIVDYFEAHPGRPKKKDKPKPAARKQASPVKPKPKDNESQKDPPASKRQTSPWQKIIRG